MKSRPTRWTPDPTTWTTLGAVAVTALTALAAASVDLTGAQRAVIVGLVALVACGFVALQSVRRHRAIRRLEAGARRLLAAEITPNTGASETPALADLQSPGTPPELAPLSAALEELGRRIQIQMKEVAKKGRNLEALIDAIDEPILATDDAERVLVCNRAAEALFDAPPGGLVGRSIREMFTQARILEMHGAARDGQTRREQLRVTTPLGARVFQVTATPLPAAWGEGVFGSVIALRDVTELAQAVQVKTDFVANASHELRTPVAAIRGAAETLLSASDDPAMSERLREMILNHALKLEEMLRDLLDLSRVESPDVPIEIAPVRFADIERAIRLLAEQACAERSLSLAFEIDPRAAIIETDRKLLILMLRNLVENATKFANEGTTVRIVGTLLGEANGPESSAGALHSGAVRQTLRLEVIDRGIGIPLQHQDRVFERYYQVDPGRSSAGSAGARRGSGLGLSIVKHAAKAVGGHAGLTSIWGRGTTAFVEIPVVCVSEADAISATE